MAIRTDRHGLEILDEDTCWQLLSTNFVGRLAVSIANQPELFPVNYVVDDRSLVFVTAEGTKLAAAVLGAGVAFEIDGADPLFHTGWSVVVRGHAREVEQMDELMAVRELPLTNWSTHDKRRWVRIEPLTVSGRRIVHHAS
ncbi:MAG: pyridoxamine 5'-phosphate oxidase family protein [Actinomycetes bacterium]